MAGHLGDLYYAVHLAKELWKGVQPLRREIVELWRNRHGNGPGIVLGKILNGRYGDSRWRTAADVMVLLRLSVLFAVVARLVQAAFQAGVPLHGLQNDVVGFWFFWGQAFIAAIYLVSLPLMWGKVFSTPPEADGEVLQGRDRLFTHAWWDVVFVSAAYMLSPSSSSEVHLAYALALAPGWMFARIRRIAFIGIGIVVGIIGRWAFNCWLLNEYPSLMVLASAGVSAKQWAVMFWTCALPRALFWGCMTIPVMFLAYLRNVDLVLSRRERETKMELEKQAIFFSTLADAMPYDVFCKDTDCKFIYANSRLLKALGAVDEAGNPKLDSIKGKTDFELKLKHASIYQASDHLVLKTRQWVRAREPHYDEAQSAPVTTVKTPLIIEDDLVGVLGVCRDGLSDQEADFLTDIANDTPLYMFQKDKSGRFVWANTRFWKDAGRASLEELRSCTDRDLYSEHDAKKFRDDDDHVMLTRRPLSGLEWHEFREGDPSGANSRSRRMVFFHKREMCNLEGEVIGVQGYFRDVHNEYVRMQWMDRWLSYTLEDRLTDLEKLLNDTLGAGASAAGMNVGRESRAIIYYLKLWRRSLRILMMDSVSLLSIPDSVHELAWKPRKFRPREAFQLLFEALKFVRKDFRFELRLDSEVYEPVADPDWIAVVLSAMLLNVAEHAAPKRRGASDQEKRTAWAYIYSDHGALTVSVSDSGPGLPKNEEGHPCSVEELCQRVKNRNQVGAGVELILRVASLCSGKLSCHDISGKGATFLFTCPDSGLRKMRKTQHLT